MSKIKNISDYLFDNNNEQNKIIKILPKVKIQEPKINNQNLKLDINININKNNQRLRHSGNQKIIINSNNNKKGLYRNISDLPSLPSVNQRRINNI